MKKKMIGIIAVVCVAAGGFARGSWHLRHDHGQNGTLKLLGNVDIRKVDLGFRVGGKISKLFVEEGERVAAGQLLAQLDTVPYEEEMSLAQAQRLSSAATLAKLETGNRPQEIRQAKALAEEREATLRNLELEYDRRKKLVASGTVSRQSFDEITAQLHEAKARLASAQQGVTLVTEGFRREDIQAGRAELKAAEARLATASTRLGDTRILAPANGILLTRVAEPGAIVRAGQTVATLSLDSPVWVRAYVDEPNLGKVYPGMPAEVYSDSDPAHPYKGHVGDISAEAEFTPKSVQTEQLRSNLVYRVRVFAENPDHGLRQGMPVTVRLYPKPRVPDASGNGK
jgi:HlyD family secretion protein